MRIFRLALPVILLATWLVGLNISIPAGQKQLPKLGSFLSPFDGFMQQAESLPDASLVQQRLNGLSSATQVHFDDRLVPHIFADNLIDAYRVLGYLHAKHRLFQMDLVSRSTSGRLAEVLGPRLEARDRLQRRRGLGWSAEQTLESWKNANTFDGLVAYSEGYNNYIDELAKKDYPIEFKLLDYAPEKWTPYRTALFLKSMAMTLCSRNYDLVATNTMQELGEEAYEALYPDQMSNEDPIIPKQVEYPFVPLLPDKKIDLPNIEELIGHRALPNPPEIIGSNNWAVSGSKTKSGYPILANDPHLSLTLPSIWYEVHIITPELNVYGVTFPGFPGVVIGFNEHIAWGMTNVGQDVTDWYTIDWVDENKEQYWLDGEKKSVDYRVEKINIKGKASIVDSVKYTHWGPIVYEGKGPGKPDLAMQWLPHIQPEPAEIEMFAKLNLAKNFDEFTKATQKHQSPPQNVVFASNSGDIAMRISGKMPLKRKGQGRFIAEGNKTENGWQGFVPADHNPAMLNPERGFVSSANQKSTDDNYPYYYNGRFEQYRGRILNRKLAKMEAIDANDMRQLQNDNYSLKAEEFVPLLLRHLDKKSLSSEALAMVDRIKAWDFQYPADAEEPTFFELWLSECKQLTWDEMDSAPSKAQMLDPQEWMLRDLLDQQPTHPFFDKQSTTEIESASDIVSAAFATALSVFAEAEKDELSAWRKHNPLVIPHLSRINSFGSEALNSGGSRNCLNAINGSFGPSWRMVVEMGPNQKAYGVYPGGQSGNPGSPFYDTGIEKWSKGELNELHFVKQPNELPSTLFIQQFNPQN